MVVHHAREVNHEIMFGYLAQAFDLRLLSASLAAFRSFQQHIEGAFSITHRPLPPFWHGAHQWTRGNESTLEVWPGLRPDQMVADRGRTSTVSKDCYAICIATEITDMLFDPLQSYPGGKSAQSDDSISLS
jgi:hypothetical protein